MLWVRAGSHTGRTVLPPGTEIKGVFDLTFGIVEWKRACAFKNLCMFFLTEHLLWSSSHLSQAFIPLELWRQHHCFDEKSQAKWPHSGVLHIGYAWVLGDLQTSASLTVTPGCSCRVSCTEAGEPKRTHQVSIDPGNAIMIIDPGKAHMDRVFLDPTPPVAVPGPHQTLLKVLHFFMAIGCGNCL